MWQSKGTVFPYHKVTVASGEGVTGIKMLFAKDEQNSEIVSPLWKTVDHKVP